MPLEKHLVVHLQEMYATEQDYREYLRGWSDQLQDQQLKSSIQKQIQGIGMELDHLKQALSMMNASPKEGMKSPFVQALKQEDQTTKEEMPEMTKADMDAHVAMTDISVGQMEIGLYQGMLGMAKALQKQDIVNLLQETIEHEQQDLGAIQDLLPALLQESQQPSA